MKESVKKRKIIKEIEEKNVRKDRISKSLIRGLFIFAGLVFAGFLVLMFINMFSVSQINEQGIEEGGFLNTLTGLLNPIFKIFQGVEESSYTERDGKLFGCAYGEGYDYGCDCNNENKKCATCLKCLNGKCVFDEAQRNNEVGTIDSKKVYCSDTYGCKRRV